ncbi:MAG: GET complex subunit get1 [Cyphobasidiales sp. Tagirdzhanova-0007]|nr:MAG: GET complex subunit get1 [Cyphobasidiales sp. Tagirdzhanova-0007]
MVRNMTSIVLFNSFLSLVGHSAISTSLYSFIFTTLLPTEQHKKQANLKKDIVNGRRELSNTSAQDDFAKWAKIRRRVDKHVADLEALNTSLVSHKSKFGTYSKVVLFLLTSGLQWYFTTAHSRKAIVYLPQDWFGPLTWFLSLPFAPKGAIGCGVYIFLVRRVIYLLARITTDIWSGVQGQPSVTPAVAVPVPAAGSSGPKKAPTPAQKKKE